MSETNATHVIGFVRQETQYQLTQTLKRLGVWPLYTEIQPLNPGDNVIGRFEFTILDGPDVDAERIINTFLRGATGYQPPDAQVIVSRVYARNNAM